MRSRPPEEHPPATGSRRSGAFGVPALVAIPVAIMALAMFLVAASIEGPAADVAPPTPWQPLDTEKPATRIAFGSCLDQRRPMPIWREIVARKPDVFLMMGDNVYGDVSSSEMKELSTAYSTLLKNEDFAAARAAMPFLATWDDHDFGLNDGDGKFPHRLEAERLFHAFWQTSPDEGQRDGVYTARILGSPGKRVQIILLDTRSFRSPFSQRSLEQRALDKRGGKYGPDPDPARTMLGEEQWRWLERELARPAELRLIVSSIQVLAEGHGWERWGHLPRERERLFATIRQTNAKGVVLLSGDRHRAALYERREGLPYPLLEVTSSSLNRPFSAADPPDAGRLMDMYGGANFGMIEIDWEARALTLTLRSTFGADVGSKRLAFRDLGHE
jgi:alkaline phosphatase D